MQMEMFEAEYQVNLQDFRRASYYGLFLRYRKPLLLMFLVVAGGLVYGIAGALGAGEINYLVLFLAGAYLIWGLVLFAGQEKEIKKYIESGAGLLKCTYHLIIDRKRMRISIPEREISANYSLSKLAGAFELSSLFLIYVSPQETYIVPVREMTDQQRTTLRTLLRKELGQRFSSRFEKAGQR